MPIALDEVRLRACPLKYDAAGHSILDSALARRTRIIKRADAHAQIAELKRQPGKEILVFGSRTLWNDLLAHGLVDELHLMIGPAFLGAGTPVFDGRSPLALRLLGSRTLEDSELVLARYGVRP